MFRFPTHKATRSRSPRLHWLRSNRQFKLQLLEDRTVPATITVNDIGDTIAVDSKVTLREALQSINTGANVNSDVVAVGAYGSADSVQFDGTVFGTPQTINVLTGQLTISKAVTITGTSAANLTIQNAAA